MAHQLSFSSDATKRWFTSSYSGGNGACVEVARQVRSVSLRDSTHPRRAFLSFPSAEWRAFVDGVQRDAF